MITGSNRSDSLIGGLISLDDFFLLGPKPEYVTVSVIEEEIKLLPFVDSFLVESKECESVSLEKEPERIQKTHPLLKWVPRTAKTVEVTIRDPFHEYGRMMLFVDSKLLVPTMAQVYDRNGNFRKFIILGNQFTESVFPVLLNVITKDLFEHLVFMNLNRCKELPLEIFDPRNQIK